MKLAIFDSFCFQLLTFVLDNISAAVFVELVIIKSILEYGPRFASGLNYSNRPGTSGFETSRDWAVTRITA